VLLEVKNLSVEYITTEGRGYAVENATFDIGEGQTVGLVGESGCGKSTLGWSIIKLLPGNARIRSGNIIFKDKDITKMSEKTLDKTIRGKEISVIVQDPQNALNPVFTINTQISDVLSLYSKRVKKMSLFSEFFGGVKRQYKEEAINLLTSVGIADARKRVDEYPHCFSGGMKQRVMMAMAFIVNPSLLIADEPTTGLDVTVQAQILEYLKHLVRTYRTAVLYITHDLGVISEIADKIMVMYAGNIVEVAGRRELFSQPLHPYTKALIRCFPRSIMKRGQLETIPGSVPNIFNLPRGCKFHPRCPLAKQICKEKQPLLKKSQHPSHEVACFLA